MSSCQTGCNDQSGSCVNVCSRLEEQGVCQCSEGFALSNHGTHCEGNSMFNNTLIMAVVTDLQFTSDLSILKVKCS